VIKWNYNIRSYFGKDYVPGKLPGRL